MPDFFLQLEGGLGNQLFQIAAAWAHCQRNGYTLKISPTTKGGRPTYWDSYLHNFKQYVGMQMQAQQALWKEPRFSYTAIPNEARSLKGYFQTSKYFAEYRSELLKLFDPPEAVKADVRKKYGALINDKANVLHIRRTDFFRGANTPIHGILTEDYYRRVCAAVAGPIVVFSDDIAWCKHLDFLRTATFVDEPNEVAALYLMTQFKRFVISNSTFSWWAAWLAGAKMVIAPDQWFGPRGPQDYQDIYEPGWIKFRVVP